MRPNTTTKCAAVVLKFGKPMGKGKAGYPGSSLATSYVCMLARQCAAEVFELNPLALKDPNRGGRKEAFARQVAVHLAHIVAGRRHDAVAREFDRNRSTASHHFEQLENLRDDPTFDHFLTLLEERFTHYLNWRESRHKGEWLPTVEALAKAIRTGRLEADAHFEAKFVVETFTVREPRRRTK